MTEALREYQTLSDNLSASIRQRTSEAKPVRLLSDSDDKKVELVEDQNGNRVIRRTYSPSALYYIGRSGLNFNTAWNVMHQEYDRVGIAVVSSFVINPYDSSNGYPIAVVAEYLEDSKSAYFASVETKKKFAFSLGNLLLDAVEVLPHPQSIRSDSFRVIKDEKEESIVLVDVDPYVIQRSIMRKNPDDKAFMDSELIKLISSLFWDDWCREDERKEVIFEFVRSLSPIVTSTISPAVEMAYMNAHAMSRGAINHPHGF